MLQQVRRLYVGDTLAYDSEALAGPTIDRFQRAALGPEYTTVNSLKTGAAASATVSAGRLNMSGYTPISVRELGQDGLIEGVLAGADTNACVAVRFVDNDNWITWAPDNGTFGRLRVRVAGVSTDYTPPKVTPAVGDTLGIDLDGADIRLYANGVLVAAFSESRLAQATKHGLGSASSGATARWTFLTWTPRAALPARYFDPAPVLVAIDAATSMAALRAAVAPAADFHGASIVIHDTATSGSGGASSTESFTIDHPNIKVAARRLVQAMSRWPRNPIGAAFTQHLALGLRANSAEVSGVAVNRDAWTNIRPTATALATISADVATCIEFTVNHEMAHVVSTAAPSAVRTTRESEFTAVASYDSSISPTTPRPAGFLRGYSRTNTEEDQADVFGWFTTPSLRAAADALAASDPGVATKKASLGRYLGALGWGYDYLAGITAS